MTSRTSLARDGAAIDDTPVNEAGMLAWRAFLTAHARVTTLLATELQSEKGLPLTWYDVLVQLQEAPDNRLRMTDLAAAVLLSKSGLTRLVDRMYAARLVDRAADAADRRGRWVIATAAGLERLEDAAAVHMRGVADHFTSRISQREAQVLAKALSGVAQSAAKDLSRRS